MAIKYLYRIIASASVWSEMMPIRQCRQKYATASKRAKEVLGQSTPVEIERVQILNNNARRYWLWRNSRWIPWGSTIKEPSDRDLQRWTTR